MAIEMVQGRYAGLIGWRVQWLGDDGEVEVMAGKTKQEILDLPPCVLEGAEVVKTVMADIVVAHTEKDGAVVLDD